MTSIPVELVGSGSTIVREEHQPGVVGLGNVGEEVEPAVEVEEEGAGVSLLGADLR